MVWKMASATKPRCLLIADDDENDYVLLNCAARRAQLPAQLRWIKDGLELLEYLRVKAVTAIPPIPSRQWSCWI